LPDVVSVAPWRIVDSFLLSWRSIGLFLVSRRSVDLLPVSWPQDLGRKLVNEIKQLINSGGQQGADYVQFALGEDRNDVSLRFGVEFKV
jgi:hypothetical protein